MFRGSMHSALVVCTFILQLTIFQLCPFQSVVANQELLADTSGILDSVVLSVNSARKSTLRNAQLITNIVNALPQYTAVNIITNDRAAFTVVRNSMPQRIRFIDLPEDNPITIWTQDPFLVVTKGEAYHLLTPRSFERSGDARMAAEVAARTGLKLLESSLSFEGGNIVSDEKNIFIGANTIYQNAAAKKQTDREIVKQFEGELGRRVLVVGPYPQPTAHIDMIITPLGDGRIAVADPRWGARIMQGLIENKPERVSNFEKLCEQKFYGNPDIHSINDELGRKLTAPDLRNKSSSMLELSNEMAPIMDNIAKAFSGFGYHVYRIPYLFGGPEAITQQEILSGQKAAYPMLTYNNVLIEQRDGEKYVYMPRYGLEGMDTEATRAWSNIGFTVRPVSGLEVSSMYGGSLRCSVKVLARSKSKPGVGD